MQDELTRQHARFGGLQEVSADNQHDDNDTSNGYHHHYDQPQVEAWESYINVSEKEAFLVAKLSNDDFVSLQHNYEGAIERGLNPWMHVNRLPSWFYKTKACLSDVSAIENIPLDFEWPADPSISHAVAQRMKDILVEQGILDADQPIEDSGAGDHLVIPIGTIQIWRDGDYDMKQNEAERKRLGTLYNGAVKQVVKEYFAPAFEQAKRDCGAPAEIDLIALDISRVLSIPGTWRYSTKDNDCDMLKQGYLRHWLPPYGDGNYPVRHNNQRVRQLIIDEVARSEKEGNPPPPAQVGMPASGKKKAGRKKPAAKDEAPISDIHVWMRDYADTHPPTSDDRSSYWQFLLHAFYRRYKRSYTEFFEMKHHMVEVAPTVLAICNLEERYGNRIKEMVNSSLLSIVEKEKKEAEKGPDLYKFEANDVGNAEAVQSLYGDTIHYNGAVGWIVYQGTHYHVESEHLVDQLIVDALRRRRSLAAFKEYESIIKCSVPNQNKIAACKARLKSLPGIYIDIKEFDSVPYQINTASGVVDLRTKEIHPHNPSQKFTYCLQSKVGTKVDALPWIELLNSAVNSDEAMVAYIQLAIGYSITGYTREEILFYLFGPTRSGKGTFIEALLSLLDRPLSRSADFNSFTAKREANDQGFDLAPLRPSRVVVASESNKYQSLNPAKIKGMTGGDDITCALKHRDMFTYRPQFKVWLVSNHPVNADADDDAMWGRVKVIEFPNSHLGKENKTLKGLMKSTEVQAGILWWAIEGASRWLNSDGGLDTPQAVEDNTRKHRDLNDYVQQWIDDCAELREDGWTQTTTLVASYTAWCKSRNLEPRQLKSLAFSLQQKGCTSGVKKRPKLADGSQGPERRGFQGISLADAVSHGSSTLVKR